MRLIVAAGILSMLVGMTSVAARADILFQTGNHPQANEENILLNGGTTGNPVFGVTNQSNLSVAFGSLTDTLTEPSSGQARVEAVDGVVNNVSVGVPGGTYTDLIVNPFNGDGVATVSVIANEPNGGQTAFVFAYQIGNGNNFLTITASNGETIDTTTIDAPGGFADLRQPRISGATLARVPESGIAILLGAALGAIAAYRKKKSR